MSKIAPLTVAFPYISSAVSHVFPALYVWRESPKLRTHTHRHLQSTGVTQARFATRDDDATVLFVAASLIGKKNAQKPGTVPWRIAPHWVVCAAPGILMRFSTAVDQRTKSTNPSQWWLFFTSVQWSASMTLLCTGPKKDRKKSEHVTPQFIENIGDRKAFNSVRGKRALSKLLLMIVHYSTHFVLLFRIHKRIQACPFHCGFEHRGGCCNMAWKCHIFFCQLRLANITNLQNITKALSLAHHSNDWARETRSYKWVNRMNRH